MKNFCILFAFLLAISSSFAQTTELPAIKSHKNELTVVHDGSKKTKWYVSPQANPDTLYTTAGEIALISPTDTLEVKTGRPWAVTEINILDYYCPLKVG